MLNSPACRIHAKRGSVGFPINFFCMVQYQALRNHYPLKSICKQDGFGMYLKNLLNMSTMSLVHGESTTTDLAARSHAPTLPKTKSSPNQFCTTICSGFFLPIFALNQMLSSCIPLSLFSQFTSPKWWKVSMCIGEFLFLASYL